MPKYFSPELLANTKVVFVDKVPTPPLSALGVRGDVFEKFEHMNPDGITYKNVYFLKKGTNYEAHHFHELIHVLQYQHLGAQAFLMKYAQDLAQYGYRNSPLEVMAYDMTDRFKEAARTDAEPFDVANEVKTQLDAMNIPRNTRTGNSI